MSSSAYSVTGMKPSTSLHSDANFELQFHILCKYRAAVQRRPELQSLAMSCHDCCCCCCSFLTRCHDAEDLPGNTKIWILELPTTRERQRTAAKSSVKHGADTRGTRACGSLAVSHTHACTCTCTLQCTRCSLLLSFSQNRFGFSSVWKESHSW